MQLFLTLLCIYTWFVNSEKQVPIPTALARQSREQISTHYHLVVTTNSSSLGKVVGQKSIHQARIEIWAQDDKLRTDRRVTESTFDKSAVGCRTITCRNVSVKATLSGTVVGSSVARYEVRFDPINATTDKLDGWRIDWRKLGLLHGALTSYPKEPAESTLLQVEKNGVNEVRLVELDGAACRMIQVPLQNRGNLRTWFHPDQGFNPIRYESSWPTGVKVVTESTYKAIPGGGGWYPSRIEHFAESAGTELLRETIVIELAEFGLTIPKSTFTLAGLGLDDGQFIALPETKNANDYPTWKNGKLDTRYTSQKQASDAHALRLKLSTAEPPTPDAPPPTNRVYYLAAAAVLAALAVVAFVLARRRQS